LCQLYSLNANQSPYVGRAYFKKRQTSIMILKILREAVIYSGDAEEAFSIFLSEVLLVENHELLHLFFKHELGKWAYAEKKIDKCAFALSEAMITHLDTLAEYIEMYHDILEWLKTEVEWE